ncbi:MAG: Fatty acid metabolism regulator protein [Syntrophus sp. PtaU1.Bin208]|nr:MAG: Fatty acid metabolism regulator protein [Syntrophus sp. PtaU1.Bin208]
MRKRDLRRQEILQAALEVFGRTDFQGACISEIAQKAKIAEGTIYFYFKNKEDLFFSIPALKIEEFCDGLQFHLQGIQDAPAKLRKMIWFYLYFFKTNPVYARILMLEMSVSKRFSKSITFDRVPVFTDRILEIVQEGQEEGSFRKDLDGCLVRDILLSFLEYRVTRWLLNEENYELLENYGEISDFIFERIKNLPGNPNGGRQGLRLKRLKREILREYKSNVETSPGC